MCRRRTPGRGPRGHRRSPAFGHLGSALSHEPQTTSMVARSSLSEHTRRRADPWLHRPLLALLRPNTAGHHHNKGNTKRRLDGSGATMLSPLVIISPSLCDAPGSVGHEWGLGFWNTVSGFCSSENDAWSLIRDGWLTLIWARSGPGGRAKCRPRPSPLSVNSWRAGPDRNRSMGYFGLSIFKYFHFLEIGIRLFN
jgi:hypothetical protein